MLDISVLLDELKSEPYVESGIYAPHSGVICFNPDIKKGDPVLGPTDEWKETPGTFLATINREKNEKKLTALEKGELVAVNSELEGQFVEAGTELLRVRHFLSKDEVLQIILQKALYIVHAPEKAKYYFVPTIDLKVKNTGPESVTVHDGMDLFIVSRMKRETPLSYKGPDGVIYALYFKFNQNIDAGQPLIGVCPPNLVKSIEEVSMRVQSEWQEH